MSDVGSQAVTPPTKRRATRLRVDQVRIIDHFCTAPFVLFPRQLGTTIVGSSLHRDDYRAWVAARGELAGYWVTCPWCVAPYVAALLVVPAVVWPDSTVLATVTAVLAVSYLAAFAQAVEDRLDR